MVKFKKGDEILVTAGKDRGKTGRIERVLPGRGVLVSGVGLYKRHTKPRGSASQQGGQTQGGIIEFPRPLPFGNVAIVCVRCKKPTRVGFSLKDKKVRVCHKCKEVIA